ncbi:hypothetical protein KSP40_PGU014748 [Platanthera guangdongensis]|uniref:Uncharacterized protein n=1 Tax=Platanthera guangdongensis TaxID=2320717 RepID=A0ABR2LCX5_9ASPA
MKTMDRPMKNIIPFILSLQRIFIGMNSFLFVSVKLIKLLPYKLLPRTLFSIFNLFNVYMQHIGLFFKQEMELSLIGLQNAGKTFIC